MNKIKDEDVEEDVPCQISPVFTSDGQISNAEYDLTFLGKVLETLVDNCSARSIRVNME